MADIYKKMYVTILASRVASVDQGFLHIRFHFGATSFNARFQLPYRSKDGNTGPAIAVEEDASVAYTSPLSLRPWAFEELVLSPRVLSYGHWGHFGCVRHPNHCTMVSFLISTHVGADCD
ncbi:hypothetical protein BJ170DRAFT_92147 [Xylariales sp. AK1849]|nr:hypothetical protein BJ170DRAFT_92147 [Xylariales sp. AK1849]